MNAATLSGGPADRSMTIGVRASRIMGWTSFGLAVAFLAAPGRIARTFGLEGKENLIRAFGVQEVVAGVGALSVDTTAAMWGRAAGDVVHIGTLATGLQSEDSGQRRNVAIGLAALTGFLLVDALIASRVASERNPAKGEVRDYSDRSGFPNGPGRGRNGTRAAAEPARTAAAQREPEFA
ncbi:MAG: hypothetical protein ACXWU1_13785 [Allosphingosinicella sp.]